MSVVTELTPEQIANRRKWADALQSSKKARHALATPDGRMCCLGVGCSVMGVKFGRMLGFAMPGSATGGDSIFQEWYGGMADGEMLPLAYANDGSNGPAMSHPDIGLYLYLTAEAGIAGA